MTAGPPGGYLRRMTNDSSPAAMLMQVAGGYVLARCLHVVAQLGVADALGDVPQTTQALSSVVGVHPDALARTLRLLAANGIFEERDGLIRHTPESSLLRTDHPRSMRPLVRWLGSGVHWQAFKSLQDSLRNGLPVDASSAGSGFWSNLARDPEASVLFNEAMTAKSHAQIANVLGGYDFSRFKSIADVGGGRGHLLRAILEATPASTGVLFDLPQVIEHVSSDSSERLSLQAGDFFTDDLPTCDCYMIMDVLQDWSDTQALQILEAVRRVTPPTGKLLVIATMLPGEARRSWGHELDIYMLAELGGRLRTVAQYAALIHTAGFEFERNIDFGEDLMMLEAVPASKSGTAFADGASLTRLSMP
jgi:hypothetical protein